MTESSGSQSLVCMTVTWALITDTETDSAGLLGKGGALGSEMLISSHSSTMSLHPPRSALRDNVNAYHRDRSLVHLKYFLKF